MNIAYTLCIGLDMEVEFGHNSENEWYNKYLIFVLSATSCMCSVCIASTLTKSSDTSSQAPYDCAESCPTVDSLTAIRPSPILANAAQVQSGCMLTWSL
jgi:hypothetical protein